MNIFIKNGHIIDPANKVDEKLDILVSDGKIAKLGKPGSISGERRSGHRCRKQTCRAGPHRHARAPARTGIRIQGNDRDRHGLGKGRRIHVGLLHAEHQPDKR